MSIACDYPGCTVRSHQPLPHGWDINWDDTKRHYEHMCPDHSSRRLALSAEMTKEPTPAGSKLKGKKQEEAVEGQQKFL